MRGQTVNRRTADERGMEMVKRVIQVGIGGMGNTWLRTVLGSSEVEHAGFVEISDEIAGRQVERYGIDSSRIFDTLDEALAAIPADGVVNVTPPQFHEEISLEALEAGLPVLSEKPLADTMESAEEIVRKSDETGVLHMVAQNYRYSIPAQTLKEVIDSEALGEVGAVAVDFFKGPHFGGFREEMPHPLVVDMSIHHFDMMRFFLGSDPRWLYGRGWNPAWSWYDGDASAAVIVGFADGVVVSYNGSWCSTGMETSWNGDWRFECDEGVISLEDDQVRTQVTGQEAEIVPPVRMQHTAQEYLLHEFYRALTEGRKPATTCRDNIRSLGMVFDTVRSSESGERVWCSRYQEEGSRG